MLAAIAVAVKSAERGKSPSRFTWVLNKLKSEREQDGTVDMALWTFETPNSKVTIIGSPDHRNFSNNMTEASVALLCVSATVGEFEAGLFHQTQEHIQLANEKGVKQIIVVVNKMDDADAHYTESRYHEVVNETSSALKKSGYNTETVSFIPISAWKGDNLVERSSNTSWYRGDSLLEAIDSIRLA